MKKVVLIYLGRKGAGPVYSLEMAKALAMKGNSVLAVLSTYCDNLDHWQQAAREYPTVSLVTVKTYQTLLEFIKCLFFFPIRIKGIRARILSYSPDCIYIPMLSIMDSFLLKGLKTYKTVVTVHDVEQHMGEKNTIIQVCYDKTIKYANTIVVLSKKFIPQIAAKYGFDVKDIIHIPHANFSYYGTHKPIFGPLKYNILSFGRIQPYKGIDILKKAYALARRKIPQLTLTIAGSGVFSQEEENLLSQLGDNVHLHLGWIADSDVEAYFENTDFVVLSYREASQSGVVPLAYSMGRSVMATNVGGLSEQILPNTLPLVEPDNPQILAQSITTAYTSGIIEQANRRVYDYAQTDLSWEQSAERLLQAIE